MRSTNSTTRTRPPAVAPVQERPRPLRAVVQDHADRCFLDTDGVTRDARRMLEIMNSWRPHRSDGEAGVRRNTAFNPELLVVIIDDSRICYPEETEHPGQPTLLFTMVPEESLARQRRTEL